MTSVLANLGALLRLYASHPGGRVSNPVRGLTLFDSGTAAAYENYALADPGLVQLPPGEIADGALSFFGAAPHIWPLFPGLDPRFGAALAARGAVRDAVWFDMSAPTDAARGSKPQAALSGAFDVVPVSGPALARAWADAVWYGFDSGEPAPESFAAFADVLIRRTGILLLGIRDRRAEDAFFAATGMLACAEGSAGIYYIATRPAYRRGGLAARVINALLGAADERGYDRVSLLATPQGRPLYERCGFAASDGVEIYRVGGA